MREIVFRTLEQYGLRPDPAGLDGDLHDIEEYYLRRGGMFEVLETEQGEIVGTVGLLPIDRNRCELRKMFLRAEWRGQGLGKRLLERAVARAQQLGFVRLELETVGVMVEALALYRRYGFREVAAAQPLSPPCDRALALELPPTRSDERLR